MATGLWGFICGRPSLACSGRVGHWGENDRKAIECLFFSSIFIIRNLFTFSHVFCSSTSDKAAVWHELWQNCLSPNWPDVYWTMIFGNFSPLLAVTLQPPLFSRQFLLVWASHPFLSLLLFGKRNYANGDGHQWRKTVDISHPRCPLHTHAQTIKKALVWPREGFLSLLAVSQADFNNCYHIASALSSLLSTLAHLSQTGQVLWREDRPLSATETICVGVS